MDKLGNHPEFFIERRSEHIDFFYLALVLFFLLPAVVFCLELPFILLRSRLATFVHLMLMGVLAALTALPVLKSIVSLNAWSIFCASIFIGLGFALLLHRYERMRQFCVALALTALAFPIFFLTRPGIKELAYPRAIDLSFEKVDTAQKSPVVLLVLSELPLAALLTPELKIDAKRFPHFAALAEQSHWFRNASAVSPYTAIALPAILTGNLPLDAQGMASSEQYPKNLFSLIGSTHYLHAWERATRLCPDSLCHVAGTPPTFAERMQAMSLDLSALYVNMITPRELGARLPDVTSDWSGFWNKKQSRRDRGPDYRRNDRARIFRFWTREIKNTERPVLHFGHHLLPRAPYQFSNSGRFYAGTDVLQNPQSSQAPIDDRTVALRYQRFLIQVAAVDALVGQLMQQLKGQGLFDRSLIIVTSDHGVSFPLSQAPAKLSADSRFYEELLSIPLFIKVPGQKLGTVDDRNVQSVDILPTIVDVLKIGTSWKFDGQSVFDETPPTTTKTILLGTKSGNVFSGNTPRALQIRQIVSPNAPGTQTIKWKHALFGDASDNQATNFSFAMQHQLLGNPIAATADAPAGKIQLMHPPLTLGPSGAIGLAGQVAIGPLPLYINGYLKLAESKNSAAPPQVVISVNNEVAVVTQSYLDGAELKLEALLPEEALRYEFNSLTFHALIEDNSGTVIAPLELN